MKYIHISDTLLLSDWYEIVDEKINEKEEIPLSNQFFGIANPENIRKSKINKT